MNNKNKFVGILIIITLIAIVPGMIVNAAVDHFPNYIKPDVLSGTQADPGGSGFKVNKIEYSSTNPDLSGKAFCTAFTKKAPYNVSKCEMKTWSSNSSVNDKVAAAIGKIIMSSRGTDSIPWNNYFYAVLAINRFLYNGYTNNKGYGTANNYVSLPTSISNNETFKGYLSAAEYEYENFKNTKISISSTKYNSTTRKATAVVTCADYAGSKIACDLKNVSISAKLNDSTISGVNVQTTQNSDGKSYTLSATIPESNESGTLKIQFSATDKKVWSMAQNYNCGENYQSLTPNMLKNYEYEKSAKSPIITNNSFKLEVHKVDADGQLLPGATVKVTYQKDDNSPVTNLISENDGFVDLVDGKFDYDNAEAGKYCITEVKSPTGYKLNSETQCKVISEQNPSDTIILTNVKDNKNLTINKVDESGNPVVGAKIKIYYLSSNQGTGDVSSNIVYLRNQATGEDFWVTDGNSIVVEGLEIGRKYTVVEDELPKEGGYAGGITSAEIVISEDSSKNIVTLTNTHSTITVSKQAINSSEELPGATLTITNAQGEVVASWISTDKPQEITGLSDGDYVLQETTAPQGYTVAESIEFTIENGKLKDRDDNTLVMKDATIVDVPDTFTMQNIIAMISGLVLVSLGTGVLLYETKKKKKA